MKAADVTVLKALDPGESYLDPTFVLVETALDASGEPTTTIEHLTTHTIRGRPQWKVATLGQSVPLSHASALEWAVSFAASRDIPVVYHRDESAGIGGYAAALTHRAAPSSANAPK
jgi:hypothetical protein